MRNRGEQALLKQSTILMFAVAIAGIVTGVISGAQSILFDGFFSLIATAINPAIGLGTFLAQFLLREPLQSATTQQFHISGGWADPKVEKIEKK